MSNPANDSIVARFRAKVEVSSETQCWIWKAHVKPNGYGVFSHKREMKYAHRMAWELYRGPIPAGMDIDHLCRNRRCVNPDHLEPVTRHENLRRSHTVAAMISHTGTCKRGHPFSGDNILVNPKTGDRRCRQCNRERSARRRERLRKEQP